MFKETAAARCLRLAFIGGIAGLSLSTAAFAQEVQQGERIEVTGSNIRRVQAETASPVQTLTRQDIERSGKTTVAELLQTMTVDNAGSVPTSFGNGFASGASGISLRGLGVGATLVLLNGRRIAPYALADDGQKQFADLNLIPIDAVERVEILTDGGSAIYGSDALAGVVNVILRKEYQGLLVSGSVGQSLKYGDGRDTRAAITGGFGNLDTDGFNILANFEYRKKEPIFLSNRTDRGNVGRTDLRDQDLTAHEGFGGTGAIVDGTGGSSIVGNIRNPTSLIYYSRDNLNTAQTGFLRTYPNAACTSRTGHAQGDPEGGCLIEAPQQYAQVNPSSESYNFFTRGSLKLGENATAYVEGNYYDDRSRSQSTPSGLNTNTSFPGGGISNAGISLGANHPDNPYVGSAARIRYLATDVGPRISAVDSQFARVLAGIRGTAFGWDYDTGLMYSRNKVSNTRINYIQRDVEFALLNPTAANVAAASANSAAYRALLAANGGVPVYWRIAENAGLNSAALYQALAPRASNTGKSVTAQADFKASREILQLPGGGLGVAFGAEFRHEQSVLNPTAGTERGNIIGLGYSAFDMSRNISAGYAEVIAPVVKWVELSAAARYDHYSDVGNSFTPKGGIKITPIDQIAIRGTFSKGFRAPNAAEQTGTTAAFSTSDDPVRCALGVSTACSPGSVALLTTGNRSLVPEKSKTYTGGIVLDPVRGTSVSVDYFKIIRKNEIIAVQEGVLRDPTSTQPGVVGDPGAIIALLQPYQNAQRTTVRGLDVDGRQDVGLGGYGKLTFGARWTHLFSYQTIQQDGTKLEYAGTHGNCDVTNCIGTPADRISASLTYMIGDVSTSLIGYYRSAIKNKTAKEDTDCANHYASGGDLPGNCRIASFTTVDLTARWQVSRNWLVSGAIQNLFDRKPPFDPLTYGAVSYNPLDFQGAVGRFFQVGANYRF